MSKKVRSSRWILSLLATLLTLAQASAGESALPKGKGLPPLELSWFPSTLHAVVFRNWELVSTDRLAQALGATPAQVEAVARSMGLPANRPVDPKYNAHTYKTVLRRNWHLLPFEQLLVMTDLTAERLAFLLHEDDFLWLKFGGDKPACPPVRYHEPTADETRRAAEMAALVRSAVGDELSRPGEPRFDFIEQLSQPVEADATPHRFRKSAVRMLYAYFADFGDPLLNPAIDPYPDGLLAQWAAAGVNGIWMHVVLRQLAPGGDTFPEWGEGADERLANLAKLAERAGRHGIKIYLYVNEPRAMPHAFFASRPELAGAKEQDLTAVCTSDPRTLKWLRDSLEHVFKRVPTLGGAFTITASENLTNCASHGDQASCPRCKTQTQAQIVAAVNAAVAEGVHAGSPTADVLAWDWGWNSHGDAAEHIGVLPADVSLISVSEWALPIERGGVKSAVGEYSISAVGPGPRALRHFQLARDRGLNVVAKIQANCTWELSSVPFLPTLDLVAEHAHNLADAGVEGLMLSWSLGGSPSPNLQVACRLIDDPELRPEQVLDDVARERYGAAAAPSVRKAWSAFSTAFREFPYDIRTVYNAPMQFGASNSLYATPTGRTAGTVAFPYDHLELWRGVYPADVFVEQMRKVATGWEAGVAHFAEAAKAADPAHRSVVEKDAALARAAGLHFASTADQSAFILARDARRANPQDAGALDRLRAALANERQSALAMYALAKQDSRIGFEASNGYYYTPLDFMEKLINLDHTRKTLAGD